MPETARNRLAEAIAETYDIGVSARRCGITVAEARALLDDGTKRQIDRAVLRRVLGTSADLTRRAVDEFTRIAFSSDEDCKITDRIRALEQLFKLTPRECDAEAEEKPERLTVIYDYKEADRG